MEWMLVSNSREPRFMIDTGPPAQRAVIWAKGALGLPADITRKSWEAGEAAGPGEAKPRTLPETGSRSSAAASAGGVPWYRPDRPHAGLGW